MGSQQGEVTESLGLATYKGSRYVSRWTVAVRVDVPISLWKC